MIPIKNAREIEAMRRSGAAVYEILEAVEPLCVPGITTSEIDLFIADRIRKLGGKSAFLNYRGYPGHACISINEEVVHGIGGKRRLQYGDIIKVDCGIVLGGWIGDSARTYPVGAIAPEVQRLMDVTQEALNLAISLVAPGVRLGVVCNAIETHVVKNGFSVVREFVGHGVGRTLHEEPQVPNFGSPNSGPKLKPGMTLAIEPMVNMGRPEVGVREDKWTAFARDGKPSAHFEHTVAVTETGVEILTCPLKPAVLK